MSSSNCVNALEGETSPYLLQHAHNPVDWYPWGETALTRAKREDRPILLSVGYSACHWCHVMAHESFEDEETARVMNAHFVNIKVDREERPDLDKIYQLSHQLLTQRPGGWPLTMFLTPDDLTPFFGGTYFPREARFGLPSFRQLLEHVARTFAQHREEIRSQNTRLVAALQSLEPASDGEVSITSKPLDDARLQLGTLFDDREGGFGGAPKFPHPTNLERLLRDYASSVCTPEQSKSADDGARDMALFTLRKMLNGGIYDQLGGGFCRYSVDSLWMIPHFEKMLYDNGPLLALCAQAWQISNAPVFKRVVCETAEWVMREMQSPDGGYYSSLDADSEGQEGKYYVWTPEQVQSLLSEDEYRVVSKRFGLDRPANFEGEAWNLHVYLEIEALGVEPEAAEGLLRSARAKLFRAREQRVRPGLDDKILTSWNALMIKGMAISASVLSDNRLSESATRALDFVRANLWREGRLLATCKDGRAHLGAYLDDYAFLIDAILELLQVTWRDEDLRFAIDLAEALLEKFQDTDAGGFYFTADDHERLMHRTKPLVDDALPAGNGVAAQVLNRLGHLLGETRYLEAAESTIRNAWSSISRVPHAHNALLLALEEYLEAPQTIILRGSGESLARWQARCKARYAPRRLSFAIPLGSQPPGLLGERVPKDDTVAYICQGHKCGEPVLDFETLERELAGTEACSPPD